MRMASRRIAWAIIITEAITTHSRYLSGLVLLYICIVVLPALPMILVVMRDDMRITQLTCRGLSSHKLTNIPKVVVTVALKNVGPASCCPKSPPRLARSLEPRFALNCASMTFIGMYRVKSPIKRYQFLNKKRGRNLSVIVVAIRNSTAKTQDNPSSLINQSLLAV